MHDFIPGLFCGVESVTFVVHKTSRPDVEDYYSCTSLTQMKLILEIPITIVVTTFTQFQINCLWLQQITRKIIQ